MSKKEAAKEKLENLPLDDAIAALTGAYGLEEVLKAIWPHLMALRIDESCSASSDDDD